MKLKNIDRAVIEVNGGCNYTCQMCPQTDENGKTGARGKNWLKKLSLTQFEEIVSACAEKGLRVVNLEGSGEATLNNNLPEYIAIVKKYGAKPYIFSNGFKMRGDYMRECVDAGLAYFRFSCIGYDQIKYMEWMNRDAFHRVLQNASEMVEHCHDKDTQVASYHLILDNNNIDFEVSQYRQNFIDVAGTQAEIWKQHNWSGVYDPAYGREGEVKTCGRPFSPDLVIRAGGLNDQWGAVHPCCQVLGRDDEAVLGHMSENKIDEIWEGELYQQLRDDHTSGNYPDYCKGCDFLIDDPEVLVWTNYERSTYHMVGTEFDLKEFQYPRT
jgi:wyosine [tRNA(Phe)-imidazoG37] synthetase (radical SAM superfamily)